MQLGVMIGTVLVLGLAAEGAKAVTGDYEVRGVDAIGIEYSGRLSVVPSGPVFRLTYHDGRTTRGMGLLRGKQLFAAWGPSDKCTVSVLEIKGAGRLEGPWAELAQDALGTEVLQRRDNRGGELLGVYTSEGANPDGKPYSGVTTIAERGAVYQVAYLGKGAPYYGIGVKQGQYLVVSYGGAHCGVTAYQIAADGSMQGIYAEYGQYRTGREVMTRVAPLVAPQSSSAPR